MAVKGARPVRVHRSEAQTLDGHRSAGYSAPRSAPRFVVFEPVPRHTHLLLLDHIDDSVEHL